MATTDANPTTLSANTSRYPLKIFNTLTKRKEDFEPITPDHVGIYLCGPTVYKEAHIGHMVGPVIFDTIARYFRYCGYQVNWVVNITDVDDKLIAESLRREIPMSQVATQMTADYCANLLEVGVDQITNMPKATEHIDEIQGFISELIEQGFAYEAGGDVFFDVARDAEYGKLTNRNPDEQQGDGGGAAGKKRSPGDFALWKQAKPGEPSWGSPWGQGRPGWHIECSAMSRKLLGKTFDIHGGGLDLTFPHHENEIAQSECCHQAPMAKYWMHNGLLKKGAESGKLGGRAEREAEGAATVEPESVEKQTAEKMSRSGGAGGLRKLLRRLGGEQIRFFLLRTHYRSTIVFSEEAIQEASTGLQKFHVFFERYERITGTSFYLREDDQEEQRALITRRSDGEITAVDDHPLLKEVAAIRDEFLTKMDDDFNTGGAVSELFQLLSALNRGIDSWQLEDPQTRKAENIAAFERSTETLRELAAILGLFLKPSELPSSGSDELVDPLMSLMIDLRAQARANKDFAAADRIRDGLNQLGIEIEDRKGETTWKQA